MDDHGITDPALPRPTRQTSGYYSAICEEDDRLAAVIRAIRADLDSGQSTVEEALANRVVALESHLENCRRLRIAYGISDSPGGSDFDPLPDVPAPQLYAADRPPAADS